MYRSLLSQQAVIASPRVTLSTANRCAFSVRLSPRAAESCAATRFHASGVFSAQNNATSVCSLDRLVLDRLPISLTSLRSDRYSELLSASGGGKRNCDGRVSSQGVIVASCGVAPDAFAGGVGRQKPREFGVPAMLCTPKNGGGVGANPSVSFQVQMVSATLCPHATPAAMDSRFSVEASAASDASC